MWTSLDPECAVAADRYLERFDWPCVADGFAVWTLAGQAFDAIEVPVALGPAVLSALRRRTGCPQDVIEVPGGCWRFLVVTRPHTSRTVTAELARHCAVLLANADRVELPPTRVAGGELRWVRSPIGKLSPPHELLAALRSCATARR